MAIYKKGSKGTKVREIQKALQVKGYYKIAIDGDFGKGTLAAVKKFQKNEGLVVDGIVGPDTWKILFKSIEVRKMRIIANKRAEASNPRWIEDVRARKLCCANGSGVVHGGAV